jgi:hypothetical protein
VADHRINDRADSLLEWQACCWSSRTRIPNPGSLTRYSDIRLTPSFTVMANGERVTFVVDAKTKIINKGQIARAIPIPPAEGRGREPAIKEGDHVTVTYRTTGVTKYASKIEVNSASSK